MRWPWRRKKLELAPQEAYDLWAETYGEPANALQKLEQQHLQEMLPCVVGARVLDLGCGRGRVAAQASEAGPDALLGLDLSLGMLARWLAPGVPRIAADLSRLPLREQSFDLAIAALVLAHLPDLEDVLANISNLIRPGGQLLLSDFHPRAAAEGWQRTFSVPGSQRELAVRHHAHSIEDYRRPLEARGWQLEELREPIWKDVPVLLMMLWRQPSPPHAGGS